jgi:O-antigen ligase
VSRISHGFEHGNATTYALDDERADAWRLSWVGLISTLIVVVMFIPIRRYTIPGGLPFQLEPYRLLVATLVIGWVCALLVDRRVALRPTGLRVPIALLLVAVLGSLVVNPGNVALAQPVVIKSLTFLLSFLLVLMLIVSVVHTRAAVDRLLAVLVGCGGVVAFFAVIEARTGANVFNNLNRVFPFLELSGLPETPERGGRARVFASAQHSIALSSMLVMLVPLAAYLAVRTGRKWWWAVAALMLVAAVSTVSRTGIVMLGVIMLVFVFLRPRDARRAIPIAIPVLVVIHLLTPGAIGGIKSAFMPSGGLLAEQQAEAGRYGSGRVADLTPAFDEAGESPILGQGYATRTVEEGRVAAILDDQWLGLLLETGIVGVFAWLAIFGVTIGRLWGGARGDPSDTGLLQTSLAASLMAFAFGLLTFDGFAFVQVTYVMFILIALSCVIHRENAWRKSPIRPAR